MKRHHNPLIFTTFVLLSLVCVLMLGACQTTKGFGKDVENLGDSIQKGSD